MADDQRAKIISLNRKRGSIKSSLTKLNSFIETDDSKDSIVYQTKLDNLLKIKQNLEQIKEEYFVTAEDSELQELEDSVEELEEQCERLEQTYKRNEEGRYIVEMPIKENPPVLGESKQIARNRLDSLIKRLNKNPQMKKLYSEFIEEYAALGHMERVMEDELPETNYFLPHHGVYREGSTSTPLRVVFNASSPKSNGVSLNDLLCKGDVVEDIFELILRFRTHKFAFTFDIQKMFRQILVVPHQRDYLRILWFDENSHQEVTFRLKTVTYGTSCAPHLAIRTIKQLALDEASDFPLASEMVLRDLYMDDGITGAPDIQTAQILQQQLIKMFARAGMYLHKWTSNSQELLNSFPTSNPENTFPIDEQVSKALGMHWKPFEDLFIFTVKYENESILTKRTVLSVIARLYDPLGLLGPVISKMKIFLQKLWLQKLTFDDPLPPAIGKEWSHLVQSLRALELVKIPRWILNENPVKLILHCFSDASKAAYGAVIYLQCISANDIVTSRLVCSKSRVSPLKTVSIPRLELCGCLLASQLKAKVEKALHLQIDSAVMYTDSTISLAWIQTPPHRLKTFVANRVGKIQQLTQNNKWQHVSSTLNPADVISRGLVPEQLIDNYLWWNGPTFLQELPVSVNCADQQMIDASQDSQFLLELKDNTTHTLVTLNSDFLTNFLKISNKYNKLIRVFNFLLRFLGNCRNKKMKGSLSSKEIEEAEFKLISLVQQNVLADDFKNLASGKQQKSKWYFQKDNISVGTMVVVKDDNVPLNSWLLGRVVKVFYGKDNIIRVCLVKTAKGTYKRPITKLAILPIET
ncbi:uncharacterized protein LOC129959887 [Argiope bruennichi]|uniref:uncharacterized protein LOC129959887 n=1 Tax=Argiope bruennichi TaxID=94029 RepID=UPI002494D096|nr:uncharacterized protein LOC129959887 [Argiope bruennichi]